MRLMGLMVLISFETFCSSPIVITIPFLILSAVVPVVTAKRSTSRPGRSLRRGRRLALRGDGVIENIHTICSWLPRARSRSRLPEDHHRTVS